MRREVPIKLNPEVLIWARKSINKTIEEIAHNIGVSVSKIKEWENGTSQPSYNQLENLAYKAYKRPIAVLFRKKPPIEITTLEEFRSIKTSSIYNCSFELFLAIRQTKYIQSKIPEIIEDNYKRHYLEFKLGDNPEEAAKKLRKFISFEIQEQKFWSSNNSLNNFKKIIEDLGIFIFQLSFPFNDARGFALIGDFPVIVINQNDSPNGRVFTLFHELYHILQNSSNIFSENNILYKKDVELKCNAFAAEFLVPKDDFLRITGQLSKENWNDNTLNSYAKIYKVSKEVILLRLINLGFYSWDYYFQKTNEWRIENEELKKDRIKKQKEENKQYKISPAQKVIWEKGKPLIKSILKSYEKGNITLASVQEVFGAKIEHFDKIIQKSHL
jgi:Zn-dependent peptidase ImmA (M78 family)